MMSNSMFKKTAVAVLLTSAPFASTEARRLRTHQGLATTPGVVTNPTDPANLPPLQPHELAAGLESSSPVSNAMNRGDQEQQKGKKKEGCCDNTCTECNNCCMYHHTDPCFNMWYLNREAIRRNGNVVPTEGVNCGCCCPCETAVEFITPVCTDVRDLGNELILQPVTECRLPSRDFICTLPEGCPIQIPTEFPQVQCPTEVPDFCCIPDIDLSQCGTGATQCLGKCGEGAEGVGHCVGKCGDVICCPFQTLGALGA